MKTEKTLFWATEFQIKVYESPSDNLSSSDDSKFDSSPAVITTMDNLHTRMGTLDTQILNIDKNISQKLHNNVGRPFSIEIHDSCRGLLIECLFWRLPCASSGSFYIQSIWLNMLQWTPGCLCVCLCVRLSVCVISTAQTN